MNKTKILISILLIDFFIVMLWALTGNVSLTQALAMIQANPWSIAAIADLLFGLALMSIVVYYNEKKIKLRLLWIFSFFLLGNIGPAIYLLIHLREIKTKLQKP